MFDWLENFGRKNPDNVDRVAADDVDRVVTLDDLRGAGIVGGMTQEEIDKRLADFFAKQDAGS